MEEFGGEEEGSVVVHDERGIESEGRRGIGFEVAEMADVGGGIVDWYLIFYSGEMGLQREREGICGGERVREKET